MDLKELTKKLCSLSGPSGFETAVFDFIADYVRPFADEIKTDAMGNLMAVKRCGRADAKMVLLDAHMDEIGFIVTGAEDGFLKFATLGGVDSRMLPAREVRVLTQPPLFGVIDVMPPHLLKADEMEKSIDIDKLTIDVGLSQDEAQRLVPPGTPVVYAEGCEELGSGQLCGKAMDDRACAAILLKAFETVCAKSLYVDVCCLISTQEEVGLRGAKVGAWAVNPDYAIVVDVTHAKTPDGSEVTLEQGKGVAIGIGPNMNNAMGKQLFRLAEELDIPHQAEVCPGGSSGTNAAVVQVSQAGVATALLSLPLKYMHTPVETALNGDMESVLHLIVAYLEKGEV
jgi:endoglucanase